MPVTPTPTANSTGDETPPSQPQHEGLPQSDSNHGDDFGHPEDDDVDSEADTAVMSGMEDAGSDSELEDEIEAGVPVTIQALNMLRNAVQSESNVLSAIDAGAATGISDLVHCAVNPARRTIFLRVIGGWSIARLMLQVLHNLSTHGHLHWIHSETHPLFSARDIRKLVKLFEMLLEELSGPNQSLKNEARCCVAVTVDTLSHLVPINRYAADIFEHGGVVSLARVVLFGSDLVPENTRKRAADILSTMMTGTSHQDEARAAAVITEMVDYGLFFYFGDALDGEDDPRTAPAVQVISTACRCVQDYGDADGIALQTGSAMLRYAVDGENASLQARVLKALYDLTSSANANTFKMINALHPLISVLHGSRGGILVLVVKTLTNVLPVWLVDDELLDQVQSSSIVNGHVKVLQAPASRLGFISLDVANSIWERSLNTLRDLTELRPSFVYQIRDADGVKTIAEALQSLHYPMKLAASETFKNCAAVPGVLDVSTTEDILYLFATAATDPAASDELLLTSARTFFNLSSHYDGCHVTVQAGGIPVLVSCTESDSNISNDAKTLITAALANFILDDACRGVFIDIQGTQVVIDLTWTCQDPKLRLSALSVIKRLVQYPDGRRSITSTHHAIPCLINLLHHPASTTNSNPSTISIPANTSYALGIEHKIRMKIMRTLCKLIQYPVTQVMIEAAGAIQVLQQLQLHGHAEQQTMTDMILFLLDTNWDV